MSPDRTVLLARLIADVQAVRRDCALLGIDEAAGPLDTAEQCLREAYAKAQNGAELTKESGEHPAASPGHGEDPSPAQKPVKPPKTRKKPQKKTRE